MLLFFSVTSLILNLLPKFDTIVNYVSLYFQVNEDLFSTDAFLGNVSFVFLYMEGLICRRWRVKVFYVQKFQTEINRFKVFDDQEKL